MQKVSPKLGNETLESINQALVRESKRIEKIRAAIDDWPMRLKTCIENKGG